MIVNKTYLIDGESRTIIEKTLVHNGDPYNGSPNYKLTFSDGSIREFDVSDKKEYEEVSQNKGGKRKTRGNRNNKKSKKNRRKSYRR